MKILLGLSVLLATACCAQDVAPRLGQPETAIVSEHKTTTAKKLNMAAPAKRTSAHALAYTIAKQTDVYWIDPNTSLVQSQHVFFADTLARNIMLTKIAKIGQQMGEDGKWPHGPAKWRLVYGGRSIIAELMIVMDNGVPREALVYRPY